MTSDLEETDVPPLVLDTSAVINMLGCGSAEMVLRCLARSCIVEERVLSELIYHPIPQRDAQREIQDLIREGLLNVVRMMDEDYELYLELAGASGSSGLGVGESAAIAIAARRGHVVVLDDRKARRRTGTQFPQLRLMSSATVFLAAARAGKLSMQQTRDLFKAAFDNGSMCILKEERALVAHLELNE